MASNKQKVRLPKAPQEASESYVAGLLRQYCLLPETPAPIARATVRLLIATGVLSKARRHVDLTATPGATLRFGPDAGSALYQAIAHEANGPLEPLAPIMRPTGISGSMGSATKFSEEELAAGNERLRLKLRDALEKLNWELEQRIGRLPAEAQDLARRVFTYAIHEGSRRCEMPTRQFGAPQSSLPPLQDAALRVMSQLGATSAEGAATAHQIGRKLNPPRLGKSTQVVLTALRKTGHIDSRRGCDGGYWLLTKGLERARQRRPNRSRIAR